MFYPGDPHELQRQVRQFLAEVSVSAPRPKAMIQPHAGYIYSGPVAASAYSQLQHCADEISRVILLGPDHRVGFRGIAAPSADYFETPLGSIPIDRDAIASLDGVDIFDAAHQQEHSLEVQLPFLQQVLGDFSLVPLVIGGVEPGEVAQVLRQLWGGDETLIVVSSDLSHYHDYQTARTIDAATTRAIEHFDSSIGPNDACGYQGVRGLLQVAEEKGLEEMTLDVRNSGDTAGPRDQVVGYGSYLFY
ncbi:MAG: AmmeMemoRadiSam system protein B [Pseudomonadota bacterium]